MLVLFPAEILQFSMYDSTDVMKFTFYYVFISFSFAYFRTSLMFGFIAITTAGHRKSTFYELHMQILNCEYIHTIKIDYKPEQKTFSVTKARSRINFPHEDLKFHLGSVE